MRSAVVGGGLAGISCALELADRGHRVTLLERAPSLGGLCRSVPDPVAGRVDTGQHVYLGCCQQLELLLERLGARPALRQERLQLTVVDPASGAFRQLRAARLPAPFHLLPLLLGWPHLGAGALAQAGRVAASLRDGVEPGLDAVPARGWLESLGQSPAMIELLWEPFLVSACNLSLEACSAAVAAEVVSRGLLASPGAGALRVPGTDLTRWLHPAAERALEGAGVELKLRTRVTSLRPHQEGGLELLDDAGGSLRAERVVLATAAAQARRLLAQGGLSDPGLEAAAELPDSPIVNVHLFTDRPFLPGPVVAVPGSPLQWVFDRSALDGDEGRESGVFHSAVSLSAADTEVGTAEEELGEWIWRLCQSAFPASAGAHLEHLRVTREAHATFAAVPGSEPIRPGPRSPVEGLLLAGSWTATGWPATMEGAVLSGLAAARAAG